MSPSTAGATLRAAPADRGSRTLLDYVEERVERSKAAYLGSVIISLQVCRTLGLRCPACLPGLALAVALLAHCRRLSASAGASDRWREETARITGLSHEACADQGAGIDSIKRRPPEFQDFRAEPFKLDGAADHCADAGVAHGRFFQQPRKIAARDRRGRGLSLTPVRAAAAAPAGGPGACAPRQCFCRSAACAWGTLMLPHRAHHRAQKIAVLSHHRFDLAYCPVTVLSGHSQAMRPALAARRG